MFWFFLKAAAVLPFVYVESISLWFQSPLTKWKNNSIFAQTSISPHSCHQLHRVVLLCWSSHKGLSKVLLWTQGSTSAWAHAAEGCPRGQDGNGQPMIQNSGIVLDLSPMSAEQPVLSRPNWHQMGQTDCRRSTSNKVVKNSSTFQHEGNLTFLEWVKNDLQLGRPQCIPYKLVERQIEIFIVT